jgi:hypothetical protein
MRDAEMIEQLYQGMKSEIAKMLRAHNPHHLVDFVELAKQIERGIDEFEINIYTPNKTECELSSLIKNFGEMVNDVTNSHVTCSYVRHVNDAERDNFVKRDSGDDRRLNFSHSQSTKYLNNHLNNKSHR